MCYVQDLGFMFILIKQYPKICVGSLAHADKINKHITMKLLKISYFILFFVKVDWEKLFCPKKSVLTEFRG